jgi:phosphoglycerate kinase
MIFLREIEVKNKLVLLRTDYDVPVKNRKVIDDSRLRASLASINYLLKKNVRKITIICHLDRPGGKIDESLRVKPITVHLNKLLPKSSPVYVEENLRFNPGEEANDIEFTRKLSKKGEIFVNDAFAVSHRKHASIVGLPKFLPSYIGFQFEKEINALNKVLQNPKRPMVVVIGGAKLETKLPLIEKLAKKADEILVGGKLAQEIGSVCSPETMACIQVAKLKSNGKDITDESAREFERIVKKSGTIVWNGPMGVFEETKNRQGTEIISRAINNSSGYTVIGGGDTEAAATKFKAESEIDHISMGGGAMLQYLAEGTLPGLEAIKGGYK